VKSIFPYVDVTLLTPSVMPCFREPITPKRLIVNIISKKTSDVNKFIRMFYWKYPILKFITFRDLRGYPKEVFAEYLREAAFTVWIDPETPFGYSAIESMSCGSIVVGKIPETMPVLMTNNGQINDNGLWSYDINSLSDILANVIGSWMQDNFPDKILESMKKTAEEYSYKHWNDNVNEMINKIVNGRREEFLNIRKTFEEQ
jgi:hypothetical protein